MKRFLTIFLGALLLLAAPGCREREESAPTVPQPEAPSAPEESSRPEASPSESTEPETVSNDSAEENIPLEERLNDIMCVFGAERSYTMDDDGNRTEPDPPEYCTSVISFYYNEEGVPGTADITPYGYFGWYLEYTSERAEEIARVIPGFERMALVRDDPVSGEIYGAPADSYETVVTAFFDVDVEALRSDDLYDAEADAYIPNGGPGIGERPTVHVENGSIEDGLIVMDVVIEDTEYSKGRTLRLTVREEEANPLGGIRFVSLVPVSV